MVEKKFIPKEYDPRGKFFHMVEKKFIPKECNTRGKFIQELENNPTKNFVFPLSELVEGTETRQVRQAIVMAEVTRQRAYVRAEENYRQAVVFADQARRAEERRADEQCQSSIVNLTNLKRILDARHRDLNPARDVLATNPKIIKDPELFYNPHNYNLPKSDKNKKYLPEKLRD